MNKIHLFIMLISNMIFSQTIITDNDLILNHGDITLYLSKDTCSMVSKHVLRYKNGFKLSSDRDNKWFKDTYKNKYNKTHYSRSGYDLGHLTPAHITSYDEKLKLASFSYFNQAPQLAKFNRGNWAKLEKKIETIIIKNQTNAIIISGVIYDYDKMVYLPNSKIPIPKMFFKVLYINNETYCWVGSNINGTIKAIKLDQLNGLFELNNQSLLIK